MALCVPLAALAVVAVPVLVLLDPLVVALPLDEPEVDAALEPDVVVVAPDEAEAEVEPEAEADAEEAVDERTGVTVLVEEMENWFE